MMSKTPRNGIEYRCQASPTWLLEVDTLFEIADAELNSERSLYEAFQSLRLKHRHNPRQLRQDTERLLSPHVQRIQSREGFYTSSTYGAKCVTRALAELWIKNADPLPKENVRSIAFGPVVNRPVNETKKGK